MKNIFKTTLILAILGLGLSSCNDFLDREPLSNPTPGVYFRSVIDLETYTISRYSFPSHSGWNAGTFIDDNGSDNQAAVGASNMWLPGEWRVGASGGGWNFDNIRRINYFIENVNARYAKKEITGSDALIKHYIGEAYFLRAYEYFNKLKEFGDFPIMKRTLPDDKQLLTDASKRRPRNEVARFILSDLDSAILLLRNSPVYNKNRISKEVAQLFKSRVALYEGTWLKYHKGTAYVPGGPGWPGQGKVDNFSINIDNEISFFLGEAMSSAKAVADQFPLVASSGKVKGNQIHDNPYFKMFGDLNQAQYSEVLLWKQYDAKFTAHHTMHYLNGGAASGYTRSLVESFVMENGLPIYAAGSGYKGDVDIKDVLDSRDHRLQLFTVTPGDTLVYDKANVLVAPYPDLLDLAERRAVTGYNIKKGVYGAKSDYLVGANPTETGCIIFRASEAYLNYIEAAYVKNGSLDADATKYWKALRARAGLPQDPAVTIAATDLSKEGDWAKYSAGTLVNTTLYNIRRERRCELIAEGMRMSDLKRWRALDQVANYQIEGFNLWDMMHTKYVNASGATTLILTPEAKANVSPAANSKYLRPYQIKKTNNQFYNGYSWTPAHYLSPIAYVHFAIASTDNTAETSVIYQNPGWPVAASGKPIGF